MERIIGKIKIIRTPEGPAPESVRINWIGVELVAIKTPPDLEEVDFTTGQEFGNRGGYIVDARAAVKALRKKSEDAALWFEQNLPKETNFLIFGPDEVEALGDDAIIRRDEL